MRILKVLLIALACMAGDLRAASFEEANELFDKGQFTEARDQYETLARSGPWTANLFYNLGDTYFRLGEFGRAALQFERALAMDPGHPEARANLAVAHHRSGAKLWPSSWLDHVFPRIRTDVYVLVASIAGWAAVACLAGLALGKSRSSLGLFACALGLVTGYAALGIWHLERGRSVAIITAPSLPARLAPADAAGVVETLNAGSQVRVLSERGEWTYCELPGNRRGWVPAGQLEEVRISRS
jgi:tetratricopeptide (TPR) repeat protein